MAQKDNLTLFKKNKKFGFKNEKGEIAISPKYDEAYEFSQNIACVCVYEKKWFADILLFLNDKFRKNSPSSFFDIIAHLTKAVKPRYGYINKKGSWILEPIYKKAYPFKDDFALVQEDLSEIYIINTKGEKIKKFNTNYILNRYDKQGFVIIRWIEEDEYGEHVLKEGFIYVAKQLAVDPKYDEIQNFNEKNLAIALYKGKLITINSNGNIQN